ncbi:polyprenol phosphomannose-dependent alpha 1,6 mannosyltransferase MptB [Nocardioides montaniterrae]
MINRGLTGSVLVLLGGLVVSTLPASAPVLALVPLAALRQAEVGRMAGLAVVLLGLGLLAHSWLMLCRYVAHLPAGEWRDGIDLVRLATVVWVVPLLLAPPLFSRDGWSYAAQGALAHAGYSPYAYGPAALLPHGPVLPMPMAPVVQAVDPMWMDTTTPYGPLPLAFGRLVAGFTGNPWVLVLAHRLLALVGLALLVWAVPRLARWTGVNPALASALVVASPLMLANGVGGLHNDLLMVGLMAAALVVGVERGWLQGAVIAGLAASVKIPGGLVCVGIALATLPLSASTSARVRQLAKVGLAALATLFGLGLATGLGNGWIAALAVPGEVNTPLSVSTLLGGALDGLARLLGLDTPAALFRNAVRAIAMLAALGMIGWVALTARTGGRAGALRAVAVTTGAFVLLAPVVHLWYLLLIPAFLAPLRLSPPAARALVAGSVVLGLVAPLDSSLHGAYEAIVLGSMLVAGLTGVLLLTGRARTRIGGITEVPVLG